MQVFVSFPDSGYPDVVFDVSTKSVVADAAQAAGDEWGADADFLEISFGESVIPSSSLLMSHGVEGGSQLTASLLRDFGREWFTDDGKREKLMQHLSKIGEQHLLLDTPSFATDGCFRFDLAWIPDGIDISFINPHPSITSAEFRESPFEPCLSDSDDEDATDEEYPVRKVDLSGLKNITLTGNGFLACSFITTLDVSCLSAVTTIGDRFLRQSRSLSSVDLSSLDNLTLIGDYFCFGCSSLSTVDLSGLSNITSIGSIFLNACSSLSSVDLSSFDSLTSIEHFFLNYCSLSSVDLSSLKNVTSIGDSFIRACFSLSSLDLSSLKNVTSIGTDFVAGCSGLTSLDLSGLNNLTLIGDGFLDGCSELSSLDLSSLGNVTSIGNGFLRDCSSLSRVNVAGLSPTSEVRKRVEEIDI